MVIFDPVGFGVVVCNLGNASGCMTDPSDSNVLAVDSCESTVREQILAWLHFAKCLQRRPTQWRDSIRWLGQLNRFYWTDWSLLPKNPISRPSRQKPRGALNSVCSGRKFHCLRSGSTQPSGEPLTSDLMFVKTLISKKVKSTKNLCLGTNSPVLSCLVIRLFLPRHDHTNSVKVKNQVVTIVKGFKMFILLWHVKCRLACNWPSV